jgi:LTXXQ motif family protein
MAMAQSFPRWALLVLAVVALAGLARSAAAQQGAGAGGSGMMGGSPGMMGGSPGAMGGGPGMMGGAWSTENYLGALKSRLGITAAEEPAWKEYADTVTGVSAQMQGVHQSMFEAMRSGTWEERRDLMNGMFEARQQAYETVHGAADQLKSALSPAQQATAETLLPGLGVGSGMMGHGDPPAGAR